MSWYDSELIIGILAVPVLVQVYAFTDSGKSVLVEPEVTISAVKQGDLPSYDYYPPLHDFVDSGYDESS